MEELHSVEDRVNTPPSAFQVIGIDHETGTADLRMSPISDPNNEFAQTVQLSVFGEEAVSRMTVGDVGRFEVMTDTGEDGHQTLVDTYTLGERKMRSLFSPEATEFARKAREGRLYSLPDEQ